MAQYSLNVQVKVALAVLTFCLSVVHLLAAKLQNYSQNTAASSSEGATEFSSEPSRCHFDLIILKVFALIENIMSLCRFQSLQVVKWHIFGRRQRMMFIYQRLTELQYNSILMEI